MNPSQQLALGFDHYSIRHSGWRAPQLIEYAARLKVDCLMLSDPSVFEHDDPRYCEELRAQAAAAGMTLQVGMLSICAASVLFNPAAGPATVQLRRVVDLARGVGSPVARCVLGKIDDRFTAAGIAPKLEETVRVLREVVPYARDAGVKIAVENHAGDLRSSELAELVERAGAEDVGVLADTGNAVWAMEDPRESLALLAPFVLSTGVRDSIVWEEPEGAAFQWTAMGEGMVDFRAYFELFQKLCPQVPVLLEIISGRQTKIPFRTKEYERAYPGLEAEERTAFLALARRGRARPVETRLDDAGFERAELEKSLRYCREVLGLGKRQ